MNLKKITQVLDLTLRHHAIVDYPNAFNGLQLENNGKVSKIAAAVDSHIRIIEACAKQKADLLITHHGLWWSDPRPMTGPSYRKIATALCANLAVYSSHLPLDLHPTLGNNRLLVKALGFSSAKPFLEIKGQAVGLLIEKKAREPFLKKS